MSNLKAPVKNYAEREGNILLTLYPKGEKKEEEKYTEER